MPKFKVSDIREAIKDMNDTDEVILLISNPPFETDFQIDKIASIDGKLVVTVSDAASDDDEPEEYDDDDDDDDDDVMLDIRYECPDCGHKWEGQDTSECDATCEKCKAEDIVALMCKEVHEEWTAEQQAEWEK